MGGIQLPEYCPLHLLTNRHHFHGISSFTTCYHLIKFFLLAGDIELNPGTSTASLSALLISGHSSNRHNSIASFSLTDLHHIDLFCLIETWIKSTFTSAELDDCTLSGCTMHNGCKRVMLHYISFRLGGWLVRNI